MRRVWLGLAVTGLVWASAAAKEALQEITVKDGDTLWGIAQTYLKDPKKWPEILKYNRLPLTDPAAALPGMKIKVPVLLIKEELRTAHFVFLKNQVRTRKRKEPEWKKASKEAELYNGDWLRTLEASEAHVRFYSGDVLKLDQNSLVVLKPELKVEEVNLLTGALIAGKLKLVTATAEVTPQTKDTLYKARLRIDKGLIVQVERGSAQVLGKDTGKTVIVKAGQADITLPNQPPSPPVDVPRLPDFQTVDFDASGKVVIPGLYGKAEKGRREGFAPIAPVKGYRPQEDSGSVLGEGGSGEEGRTDRKFLGHKSYRIQFSLSPRFREIAFDRRNELGNEDPLGDKNEYNLPDGIYSRRVYYYDEAGRPSDPVDLPTLEIDNFPPKLTVTAPPEKFSTRNKFVQIEGQTEARCFVRVNDYQVPIKADAKFTWSVLLQEGENKIRVVATDKKGKVTRAERTVMKLQSLGLPEEKKEE